MKHLSAFFFSLVLLGVLCAQDYTTENGTGIDFWTDTDSWDNGTPTCATGPIEIEINRDIVIRNTVVTLNCEVHITVTSTGRIRFGNNGSVSALELGAGSSITLEPGASVVTNSNGGDHANNSISINGSEVWNGDGNYDFTEDVETVYEENNTLPIELLSFEAKRNGGGISLSWTTSTEVDNDYFTIYRSPNGFDFTAIAQVDGAGNSNEVQRYTYIDRYPVAGKSYYKLRQTDYDGQFEEFQIISVQNDDDSLAPNIEIYPNPCMEKLICRGVSDPEEVRILDEYGKEVNASVSITTSTGQAVIDVTKLPGGAVYLLSSGSQIVRFVKN